MTRIGFFLQGAPEYTPIAKRMVESARAVMPETEIYQLTDETTPLIEGAIGRRIQGQMPMGVRRIRHYAHCEGDWILVDCDVIFLKSVLEVFDDKDFDIAVTDRIGTEMEGTQYAQAMPYNFGVIFSRRPQFWQDAEAVLIGMSPSHQEWGGEQRVLAAMVAYSSDYQVKVLPGRTYNYPPVAADDPLIAQAAIVHLKGRARKTMNLERAA